MKPHYLHMPVPEITADFLKEGDVLIEGSGARNWNAVMDGALVTCEIARRIGIMPPSTLSTRSLPYDDSNDNTVFAAPLISAMLGRRIHLMRGWRQFASCIKGFNALGLVAEQVIRARKQLHSLSAAELNAVRREFLYSRKESGTGISVFAPGSLDGVPAEKFTAVDLLDLALWKAFARRTIVCSTSSNMGISLHEALRYMQARELRFLNKRCRLLNSDEGGLVIWCPDEAADFMNPEKTAYLNSLAAEAPPLTRLRTYINRVQRDPGALRDALLQGGYFFPTNPQSKDEIQNLLFFSLTELAKERGVPIAEVLDDDRVADTLDSLQCRICEGKVFVTEGVEGGISGLMVPYLLMLEEVVVDSRVRAVSTWNQASIGAALAAAILADNIIRQPSRLDEGIRSRLYSLFPNVSRFLDSRRLGKDLQTRIHGVFDLANIQSLAQLLGVVVDNHLSGRGSAYVGLGSSSYSNGNRCFEILRNSYEGDGAFRGKEAFHPATHTMNPFAQAIVYGEDICRCIQSVKWSSLGTTEAQVEFVLAHVRKPEPAGAAAMAGYILSRLDAGTFSIMELALTLRLMGFTGKRFLRFTHHSPDEDGVNRFLQEASEEGVYMGEMARNILQFLDWPVSELASRAAKERTHSLLKNRLYPLDDPDFELLDPHINIYMTGDNTFQPDSNLLVELIESQAKNLPVISELLETHGDNFAARTSVLTSLSTRILNALSKILREASDRVEQVHQRAANRLVSRLANESQRNTGGRV